MSIRQNWGERRMMVAAGAPEPNARRRRPSTTTSLPTRIWRSSADPATRQNRTSRSLMAAPQRLAFHEEGQCAMAPRFIVVIIP
jgi:hypothetical protein